MAADWADQYHWLHGALEDLQDEDLLLLDMQQLTQLAWALSELDWPMPPVLWAGFKRAVAARGSSGTSRDWEVLAGAVCRQEALMAQAKA